MYVMRAGPQLGVDAYGVSGFTRSCAPASSPRDSRFARYCEEVSLDDVFIRLKLVDSLAISGNNGNYYDSSETSSIAFRMRAAAPP